MSVSNAEYNLRCKYIEMNKLKKMGIGGGMSLKTFLRKLKEIREKK